MAESLAIWADILWDRGDIAACEKNFFQAREMGWTGLPPWGRERRVYTPEPGPQERTPIPIPKPEPVTRRTPPKPKVDINFWELSYQAPMPSSRNSVWHGLLGVPPFEEARAIPESLWLVRARLEMSQGDFSETAGGGQSRWDAVLAEESVQIDYGIVEELQVGLRVTLGELLESSQNPIRVFDSGTQIVPTGRRHWAPSEVVLRGKYATDLDNWSIGALTEVKFGIADSEDLLTSGTTDIGLVALVTYRTDRLAVHANLGFVLPVGSADLFQPDEDPNSFFVGALGVTLLVSDPIAILGTIDFNTSGWSDIAVLDEAVLAGSLSMRWRVNDGIVVGAGFRTGAGELSGGAGFFAGVEATW